MPTDCASLGAKSLKEATIEEAYELYGKAPSQQRKRYGLLMDRTDEKFNCKNIFITMLKERPDYVAVPICLEHELSAYQQFNLKALVQKLTFHLDPAKPKDAIEEDDKRIKDFVKELGVEMLDDIDRIQNITQRTVFVETMNEFIAEQSEPVRNKFKMPPSVEL